ncbi:Hypothetical predicted protein, partial [Olea europaea subsp. europaea]
FYGMAKESGNFPISGVKVSSLIIGLSQPFSVHKLKEGNLAIQGSLLFRPPSSQKLLAEL